MEKLLCLDSEAKHFGLFDFGIAPDLLLYSYVPVIIIALLLGLVIFRNKSDFSTPNKLFFVFTIVYSLYLFNEIIQWVTVPAGLVNFAWELVMPFYVLISFLLFYFVYTFEKKQDLPVGFKIAALFLWLPYPLLLPTTLNTYAFDILYCEAEQGYLLYYTYFLILLSGLAIAAVSIQNYLKPSDKTHTRLSSLYIAGGSIAMLYILLFADFVSEFFGEFEFNLIGPIGMLLFLISIVFIIVRFSAFNIKLASAQALVGALILLVGAQLLYVESTTNFILVAVNVIVAVIGGYLLIASVKKEIQQREELEVLTDKLEIANERLKELDKLKSEFVSIASHQLRSPLTAIRGYASMLAEGSFGKLPEKAQESASRIAESARLMAMSVEDYLNVSRIESGNMKYELSDFNLRDKVEEVTEELKPVAMGKNLILLFRSDLKSRGIVHADVGKTVQICHNLINNSIKYTEKGSVSVFLRDDVAHKKIILEISDTGVGMSQKTISTLFQKFSRADNANKTNNSGTGLGLFVAHKMAEGMGGDIRAESDGEGKGSRFVLELPLAL